MAIKYFYTGGMGPYFYDDDVPVLDPEGLFPGKFQHAVLTDGPIRAGSLIADKIVEVFIATGTIDVDTQMVFASGSFNLFLPTALAGEDGLYEIKNEGVGVVILMPNSTDIDVLIELETYQPLNPGDCISLISRGDSWRVI